MLAFASQLRHAKDLAIPVKKDSTYKPIKRTERRFAPLRVPQKLQAALPFASKPKLAAAKVSF